MRSRFSDRQVSSEGPWHRTALRGSAMWRDRSRPDYRRTLSASSIADEPPLLTPPIAEKGLHRNRALILLLQYAPIRTQPARSPECDRFTSWPLPRACLSPTFCPLMQTTAYPPALSEPRLLVKHIHLISLQALNRYLAFALLVCYQTVAKQPRGTNRRHSINSLLRDRDLVPTQLCRRCTRSHEPTNMRSY
jgi:hypothetical protein